MYLYLDAKVHHEREVVPQVVLVTDVVLEAHRVLPVEGVAIYAAHEAHIVNVVLVRVTVRVRLSVRVRVRVGVGVGVGVRAGVRVGA